MKRQLPNSIYTLIIILFFSTHFAGAQNAPEKCTFVENGGILTVEMESTDISGTHWAKQTEIDDYTGSGYLQYMGGDATGVPGKSVITYTFEIQNPGRYSFKTRTYRTVHYDNDVWARFPQGGVMTKINGDSTGSKGNEWFKFMIGARNQWSYFMKTQYAGQGETLHDVYVDFPAAGVYTVEFSGRAVGFRLDRFTLYKTSGFFGMDTLNPESEKKDCQPISSGNPYVANAIPDQSVNGQQTFNYTMPANTFTDPEGDMLDYTSYLRGVNPLPSWLSFNVSTRTFTGTPTYNDGGKYFIVVKAVDDDLKYAIEEFELTVLGNNPPSVAHEIGDKIAKVGKAFNLTFAANTFTDADNHAMTYTANGNEGKPLPAWLSFNASTRTFSGTPALADVKMDTVFVTANDGFGGITETRFFLNVKENEKPMLNGKIEDQTVNMGATYNFVFGKNLFEDNDDTVFTYSMTLADGSPLPAWLSFTPAERRIAGTPMEEHIGNLSLVVMAADEMNAFETDTFTLDILSISAVNKADVSAALQVFPNPADGEFVISHDLQESISTVSLLDTKGKIYPVALNFSGTSETRVNAAQAGLPSGLYIVKIETASGRSGAVKISVR
jgi:hypothetical protein